MKNTIFRMLVPLAVVALVACNKGPLEQIGYKSDERAIEQFRVPGMVGTPQIVRTPDEATVTVTVLSDQIDLSHVSPQILVSLGASVTPASGEEVDFAANANQYTYVVTSEKGTERVWTVKIEPFILPTWIGKTWTIKKSATSGGALHNYTVIGAGAAQYPGANPLGRLTDHLDTKGFMTFIKTTDGVNKYTRPLSFYKFGGLIPSIMAEYDNTLTFSFTGLSADSKLLLGELEYGAGPDGKYTDFPVVTDTNPKTGVVTTVDLAALLRQFPMGKSTFSYDLTLGTFTFYDDMGRVFSTTSTRGTVIANNGSTTVTIDKAFTYDEAAGAMQLRFQPRQQKLPGMYTEYTDMKRVSSTVPWVDLSSSTATSVIFYQLSGTEEVWYDLVLVP